MTEPDPHPRHARRRPRRLVWAGVALLATVVLGGSAAMTAALTVPVTETTQPGTPPPEPPRVASAPPEPAPTAPAPTDTVPPADPAEPALCDDPAVVAALDSGPDAGVIAAVGGAVAFRDAVADGSAPCLDLADARRIWVVVNKRHALDPIDYWPVPQARAAGVQRTSGGHMRADVAEALSQLATAAAAEGPGAIGVNSGFRSYDFQVSTYRGYVASLGRDAADRTSARPGHSEHQTGLAVDVVACHNGCGGIESFGRTAQSEWVAAEAWRFGFVVRYDASRSEVTGYDAEPWHLRFIGVELAAAYHAGGYRSLEEFFGLEPAPDYVEMR